MHVRLESRLLHENQVLLRDRQITIANLCESKLMKATGCTEIYLRRCCVTWNFSRKTLRSILNFTIN